MDKPQLKIVGIGISAEGSETVKRFFDHTPPDTGLSFVVIQHTSPGSKDTVSKILRSHTQMNVSGIYENTRVLPNNIYLLPSGCHCILEGEEIKPIAASTTSQMLGLPIDMFFHSLGKELGTQSIGILLADTEADGARGVQTIQAAGGSVFVQDSSNHPFSKLPNAATSVVITDQILTPTALAREVVNISQKEKQRSLQLINLEHLEDRDTFSKILIQLLEHTKMDFREYRQSTLIRRIEKRMYLNQYHDLKKYYLFFQKNEEEIQALFKEFLIGITRFFRDPEAFLILKKEVIPSIVSAKKDTDPIRIWIPGCSTGEEAYSIAFLMADYLHQSNSHHSFKIFATDLDEDAIKFASKGHYSNNIEEDVPVDLLEQYFIKDGNEYKVTKKIRESIVFTTHNTVGDPPFMNVDLISCRNMMIYFNSKIQKQLLVNFQFALNPAGYLFLGPTETISAVEHAFDTIDSKWNIHKLTQAEKTIPISNKPQLGPTDPNAQTLQKSVKQVTVPSRQRLENYFAEVLADKYAPHSLFVDQNFNIIYINGAFDEILWFPRSFAKLNLLNLLPREEHLLFKTGVRKTLQTKKSSAYKNVKLSNKGHVFDLHLQFHPFESTHFDELLIWIEFNILDQMDNDDVEVANEVNIQDYQREHLETLEYELRQIKREKQSLIEQLETANEELQSTNEELLVTNQELQSTNEELQSVNEELYSVNNELQNNVNELLVSNNDINNLLRSTEIATIFLDQNLIIRKHTPESEKLFKLTASDVGRKISNFAHSFNDQDIYKDFNTVLKTKQIIEQEVTDQSGQVFLMRILPYWEANNQINGIVLTFVNITTQKNALYEFHQIAEIYKAISNNTSDIIIELDTAGIVQAVNFKEYGPLSDIQFLGKAFLNSIREEYYNHFQDAFKQLIKEQVSSENFEIALSNPQGKELYFSTSLTPVVVDGELHKIILICRNVTHYKDTEYSLQERSYNLEKDLRDRNEELESTNQELQDINQYLDSFVHGAAHDLRSPVIQMKSMLNLFPRIQSSKEKEDIIIQFSEGVMHMESTINGLIEMIEFQKHTDELITHVNVIKTYEQVYQQLSRELEQVKGTIRTNLPAQVSIPYIKAFIRSIFYNLISNAIKYRSYDRPLEIDITIKQTNQYTIISVQDNGIGIDMDRYGHLLFKPFKRLTVERKGTGIGLSIINNAICKNGGKIEVESKLDKGALFKVYLKPYPIEKHQESPFSDLPTLDQSIDSQMN